MGNRLLHGKEVDDGPEGAESQANQADEARQQEQRPPHSHRCQNKGPGQQGQGG